jgi:hypothetical protein
MRNVAMLIPLDPVEVENIDRQLEKFPQKNLFLFYCCEQWAQHLEIRPEDQADLNQHCFQVWSTQFPYQDFKRPFNNFIQDQAKVTFAFLETKIFNLDETLHQIMTRIRATNLAKVLKSAMIENLVQPENLRAAGLICPMDACLEVLDDHHINYDTQEEDLEAQKWLRSYFKKTLPSDFPYSILTENEEVLYEDLSRLFIVRCYDRYERYWFDVSSPVKEEDARRIWNEKTHDGEMYTCYEDGTYYEIFRANTTMLRS